MYCGPHGQDESSTVSTALDAVHSVYHSMDNVYRYNSLVNTMTEHEPTPETLTQEMMRYGLKEFVGMRVTYSDDFINWQLGEEHPINPIRSYALVQRLEELEQLGACKIDTEWNRQSHILRTKWEKCALEMQPELVDSRKTEHSELWESELTMFGATHYLTETLIRESLVDGKIGVYFNPAGGENNQHEDVAVVSDLAWACKRLQMSGMRVAYIDWDAHHCTDVESLLVGTGILVSSVHSEASVGQTELSHNDNDIINYEMPATSTDEDLISAVGTIVDTIEEMGGVDVIVLNIGADGLEEDESSDLRWTQKGYYLAAQIVGEYAGAQEIPVLIGGGGGTLPLEDGTPEVWFAVSGTITMEMSRQQVSKMTQIVEASQESSEHYDRHPENDDHARTESERS